MRLLAAISVLLIVSALPSVWADDAALGGVGGAVKAMDEHPSIRMESERVCVTLWPRVADVECRFVFRNTGGPAEVTMGFPEVGQSGRRRGFEWFRAQVDGRSAVVQTTPWENETGGPIRWRVKTVHFGRNQTRVVSDFYRTRTDGPMDGTRWFWYNLYTGSSWKGPIRSADIIIDISHVRSFQSIDPRPTGFERTGDLIKWHFENFEPDGSVGLMYAPGYSGFVIVGQPYWSHGMQLSGRARPRIEDGVLMVPASLLPHLLGGAVGWDSDSRSLTYHVQGTHVSIGVPGSKANVHGHIIDLPRRVEMADGRVMTPLAALARLVSAEVRYNPDDGKTYITRPGPLPGSAGVRARP
jgi:hypothetical protein